MTCCLHWLHPIHTVPLLQAQTRTHPVNSRISSIGPLRIPNKCLTNKWVTVTALYPLFPCLTKHEWVPISCWNSSNPIFNLKPPEKASIALFSFIPNVNQSHPFSEWFPLIHYKSLLVSDPSLLQNVEGNHTSPENTSVFKAMTDHLKHCFQATSGAIRPLLCKVLHIYNDDGISSFAHLSGRWGR